MSVSSSAEPTKLKRDLGPWQVLGVSIGAMGLSLSANINPQGAEPTVGRAIPLTFVIAMVAVLLLSHSFYRLGQHFHASGSVFSFVGATLGPRAGAVAGWGLLCAYLLFGAGSCYGAAIFFNSLLGSLGAGTVAHWVPYVVTLGLLAIATFAAVVPARRGTSLLLLFEVITVLLIVIISVIVVVTLIGGSAPHHARFTLSVFSPQKGTSTSSLFLGAVFGVLAFIGFEGAATMGEEAKDPRRSIPRALFGTVLIGGVFYTVTSAIEVMGFGTNAGGLNRFHESSSLFGTLGGSYVASWLGDVVTVGTMLSALAGSIGCIVGASRIVLAMARASGRPNNPVLKISPRFRTPTGAIALTVTFMTVSVIAFGFIFGTLINNAWAWTSTIGTLTALVAYILVAVGAGALILRGSVISKREAVVPAISVLVLGYIIYRNVVPYPTGPLRWLPVAAGAWTLFAIIVMVVSPKLARRVGQELDADGLTMKRQEPLAPPVPETVEA